MPSALQLQLRSLEQRKKKLEEELDQGRVIYGATGTSYSPHRKKYKDEQVALLEEEITKLRNLSMKSAEAGMLVTKKMNHAFPHPRGDPNAAFRNHLTGDGLYQLREIDKAIRLHHKKESSRARSREGQRRGDRSLPEVDGEDDEDGDLDEEVEDFQGEGDKRSQREPSSRGSQRRKEGEKKPSKDPYAEEADRIIARLCETSMHAQFQAFNTKPFKFFALSSVSSPPRNPRTTQQRPGSNSAPPGFYPLSRSPSDLPLNRSLDPDAKRSSLSPSADKSKSPVPGKRASGELGRLRGGQAADGARSQSTLSDSPMRSSELQNGEAGGARRSKNDGLGFNIPSVKAVTDPFTSYRPQKSQFPTRTKGQTARPQSSEHDPIEQLQAEFVVTHEASIDMMNTIQKLEKERVKQGTDATQFLFMRRYVDRDSLNSNGFNLESFPDDDVEAIDSPRSILVLCRNGIAPEDLKATPVEHFLSVCNNNMALAELWYAENEKRRAALLEKMCGERQDLILQQEEEQDRRLESEDHTLGMTLGSTSPSALERPASPPRTAHANQPPDPSSPMGSSPLRRKGSTLIPTSPVRRMSFVGDDSLPSLMSQSTRKQLARDDLHSPASMHSLGPARVQSPVGTATRASIDVGNMSSLRQSTERPDSRGRPSTGGSHTERRHARAPNTAESAGHAMGFAKEQLRKEARKERALTEKLAKAEKRRNDRMLAFLLERKELANDLFNDVETKHKIREDALREKKRALAVEMKVDPPSSSSSETNSPNCRTRNLNSGPSNQDWIAESHQRAREHRLRLEDRLKQKRQQMEAFKRAMQAKNEAAEANLQVILEERNKKVQEMGEIKRIKFDHGRRKKEQLERALMYQQHLKIQRIARDEQRIELLRQGREILHRERSAQKVELAYEKKLVGKMIQEFTRWGTLHKSLAAEQALPNAPPLPPNLDYLLKQSTQPRQDIDPLASDKNPNAIRMNRNQSAKGHVEFGRYQYYKLLVQHPKTSLKIHLRTHGGDSDLYVGNITCPFPSKEDCIWKRASFGDDRVTINYFDEHFKMGWYYIGVYGAGKKGCDYTLSARWKDATEYNEKPLSSIKRQASTP